MNINSLTQKVILVTKFAGLIMILMIYDKNQSEQPINLANNLWLSDYEVAKKKAEIENKAILIYFDKPKMCEDCTNVSSTIFRSHDFKSFANENLILLKLSFPSYPEDQNPVVKTNYGKRLNENKVEEDSPLILILDKSGNLITQINRKSSQSELESMIKKGLKSL